MTEESNTSEASTPSAEVTSEQSSEETQSTETQSSEQADTSQKESKLTDSMAIEKKEVESEISTEDRPSLDDIVNEAMDGDLSEESLKLVEDSGLGPHLEMLVEGHRVVQERNNNEVFNVVGGEESYKALQEWGQDAMDADQQEAFNEALFSGNMHLAKLAVQGLKSQYEAANGQVPDRVIEGGGGSTIDGGQFTSVAEYIKISRTQKYKRDPEYKASIEAKRDKSGF